MSSRSLNDKYNQVLLDRLNGSLRKEVESVKGQLILLKDFKAFQEVISKELGFSVMPAYANKAILKGREKAAELSKRTPKRIKDRIKRGIKRTGIHNHYTLNEDMFIIPTFASAKTIKTAVYNSLEKDGVLSKEQKALTASKTDRGHGALGDAVAMVDIAGSAASLTKKERESLGDAFDAWATQQQLDIPYEKVTDILTKAHQIVKKDGSLQARYFSILAFQEADANRVIDRTEETAIKSAFRRFIKDVDFTSLEGSSSLKQKVSSSLVEIFEDGLRQTKNSKVVGKKYNRNTKSESRTTTSASPKPKVTTYRSKTVKQRKTKNKGVAANPLALIQALNAKLPAQIAKNMQSPALNYRTGRFASSVKVIDAATTAQGFLSFGYTYMKYPYQTFEPGFAQGSVERDPRKLIDRSMREIAAEFAIGRFYTRRL